MKQIGLRLFIDDEILENEYEYLHGSKKDELVDFIYYHLKKDRETSRLKKYKDAYALAISRTNDGRYKNYEFWIKNI